MDASWKLDKSPRIKWGTKVYSKKKKNNTHKEEQQKSNVYTFVLYNEMEE